MAGHGGLTAGQLVLLALGTVIGGSFFFGSAIAIRAAGPAILLGFVLGAALVYIVLAALAELTTADPHPGSFRHYAERAYGPLAGFVVGWVYWAGLTLAMSSEATAAAVFLRSWTELPAPVLATLVVLSVTVLNLLGARQFARLEGILVAIKVLAVVGFIAVGAALILGLIPGRPAVGWGALAAEPFFPAGLGGLAGSMLIVIFTYAGFEVIGLAAPEAHDPARTVPRANLLTTLGLTALYVVAIGVLLPLIPTARLTTEASPWVAALGAHGIAWAARAINGVVITAILSTILAALFGLGRVVRSLAEAGYGPAWLCDRGEVPRRGILFSGLAMLAGVSLGYVLPRQAYLFLVSAGGFAFLLVYLSVVAAQLRLRRVAGCPPPGRCQVPGYPYTSWLALAALVAITASMPLVPGQGSGLVAGLALTGATATTFWLRRAAGARRPAEPALVVLPRVRPGWELARELGPHRPSKSDRQASPPAADPRRDLGDAAGPEDDRPRGEDGPRGDLP
ncbi:MAG: amino acid permease [Bacillota bacterium]|nr:MAG: amino acid permease [Bacillota bacterium]